MENNINRMVDRGSLSVGVFTPNKVLPVDGARILIRQGGQAEIVEELITNSSGQTDTVLLKAPPVDYSLLPESESMPYAEYDLEIEAEGFEPCTISGAQVLADAAALQSVELVPRKELNGQQQEIIVPPNTLWGTFPPKIPEDEVKPLPPSKGFVVLPEPVIPEFMIVHDGRPNDATAKNYWVPFKEYIKNVASCEIYATWPEATLEANILAILSFTLNRVYTEWYRGKGYDFTITSSTAYDHKFSYGRNIFSEISAVVDRIFTSFITRPNIRQPLFTQYCDGKQVQCPNWMTQWGSKTLGDQGYASMDILKHFYGYDVFLMQAGSVEGVPSSFPGQSLQAGSTGASVRVIQEQLNRIADNYPAIPKVAVDGIYGEQTVRAVTQFQQIFKLNPTGVVDRGTWYSISNIYVAVTRMAELG
ncbi:peptidoglycan-binding protein [Eubacteriales bacterium OttesenSCG-928-K08]|nr:peptidoglycan-binding protein [Eubacteriales bacterium OttesenSCG-928-K08]